MLEWSVAGWRIAGLILIATDHWALRSNELAAVIRATNRKPLVMQDGCGKFHRTSEEHHSRVDMCTYICCVWKSKAASGSSSYYHKICRDNACATRNPMQIRFSGLADTFTDTDTTERYCPVRPCSGWPVHLGAPHERVVKHQVFGG